MEDTKKQYTRQETIEQVRLALRRAAMLYHHFSKTMIEGFGEEKGRELIAKAIKSYGAHVGEVAKKRAQAKGLDLTPENFQDDLPICAWDVEKVEVDGEARLRVYRCPLAEELLDWGDPETARTYCYVDQHKVHAFNPGYECIHLENVLDGDPHCEMVVRPVNMEK